MSFLGCSDSLIEKEAVEKTSNVTDVLELSYPVPLADYSKAAVELFHLSPNGIAIGEVHGQIAGVMLLEAVLMTALKHGRSVVILHEFSPKEASLNLGDVPSLIFRR